jgi:hypothetical protein
LDPKATLETDVSRLRNGQWKRIAGCHVSQRME